MAGWVWNVRQANASPPSQTAQRMKSHGPGTANPETR